MDKYLIVANPDRTAVVVHEETTKVTVSSVGLQGPPGPQGPAGVGNNTQYEQVTPASNWIINHNSNSYPAVTVIIGGVIVYADVAYNSLDSLTITFPSPESGLAILS